MVWKLTILVISIVALAHAIEYKEPDHGPAEYEFHYSVHDPHTGDIKSQKEVRHGDKVEGVYELIEPDGHKRIVHYKADHHSGFEAVVHREPTNIKIPIPEQHHKIITHKVLTHAPLVHYSHAPEPVHHYAKSIHAEPHYDTHVHVSAHGAQYKY